MPLAIEVQDISFADDNKLAGIALELGHLCIQLLALATQFETLGDQRLTLLEQVLDVDEVPDHADHERGARQQDAQYEQLVDGFCVRQGQAAFGARIDGVGAER